jgi:hypothetical protein
MFLFTDFVSDPVMRYNVGYSLIAFTVLNISVNICIMVIQTGKSLFRIYKVLRQKYRQWKHNKEKA